MTDNVFDGFHSAFFIVLFFAQLLRLEAAVWENYTPAVSLGG
jgi:hypothetical protein